MVLALVLKQDGRSVGLVSESGLVDEADSALPVAVEDVTGDLPVDLVLAADEIPHEIAPVHPVQLIVEEEGEVGTHRGFAMFTPGDAGSLALHI